MKFSVLGRVIYFIMQQLHLDLLPLTPASHMEVGCPGTWGLELPTPTQVARALQKPALPATSHEPRQPYPAPAQAPVTQSQKLCGNNDNSNNH